KKYSFNADVIVGFADLFSGRSYNLLIGNTYRFSDKFSISQTTNLIPEHNNAGFADIDSVSNDIIFSRRNRNTVENILNLKYNFNKNNGITFRARHYWSQVNAKELY